MAQRMDEDDEDELHRAQEISLACQGKAERTNSNQSAEPNAKRSKASAEAGDTLGKTGDTLGETMTEEKSEAVRQRELRAAAAEKRMQAMQKDAGVPTAKSLTPSSPAIAPMGASRRVEPVVEQSVKSAEKGKAPIAIGVEGPNVGTARNAAAAQQGPASGKLMSAEAKLTSAGAKLTSAEAERLYRIVFGTGASPDVLKQWSRQGFRCVLQ